MRIYKSIKSARMVNALDEWWKRQVVAVLSIYRFYNGMDSNILLPQDS